MRTNILGGLLSFFMVFSFCLKIMGNGEEDSANGLYMKISGKVIQKETEAGVSDVQILLSEINSGEIYSCISNVDGNFVIRMVPQGVYEISEAFINMSCPDELIVNKIPDTIVVSAGRDISGLKIYLQRGAIISGYVYSADGVTPLKDVEIIATPWIYGKVRSVFTDSMGKYTIKGLDEGDKFIYFSAQGFGLESTSLHVKPGENYENNNCILGRGNVTVRGKVVSSNENKVVKDTFVYFTYLEQNQHYSGGWGKTDNNGEYSIIGLRYPGTFEISIVHDEYDQNDSHVLLNDGGNILNLEVELISVLEMTHTLGEGSSALQNQSNTKDCMCDPFYKIHNYDSIQDDMCKMLNEKIDCIGDGFVQDCLKNRCIKRNYTIVCDPNCPPKMSARVRKKDMNIGDDKLARMFLCTNNGLHSMEQIRTAILHELFHMCDRGANKEQIPCAEWRDYRAMYCVFRDPKDKKYRNMFKQMCKECLFKGENCGN